MKRAFYAILYLGVLAASVPATSISFGDVFIGEFAPLENEEIKHPRLLNKQQLAAEDPPSFVAETFGNSTIIGKTMMTIKNRAICAFQGFRYGDATGPSLRFKPPKAVNKFWDGDTFNAIHIGFKCPQGAMIGHGPSGDEDCLYLNVYTPYPPSEITEPLPVMFFIHGGGFTGGDASMYLPTKLLDHDVILVTIHYRLGLFGFFTLNNEDSPGNTGLYDMISALQWTQEHISDFGGDPDKVTIFGESAGSVSVNYMLILPAAKGLFRGVIAESGSALDHWAIDEDPSVTAEYVANYLSCPTDNKKDMFDCLVLVDTYDLVRAESSLQSYDMSNGGMGFKGASPTLQDPSINATDFEPIFTKYPRQYFEDGETNDVPFMTGANKQEGSYVLGTAYWGYYVPNGAQNNVPYLREESVNDILKALGIVDETQAVATSMTIEYCNGFDLGDFIAAAPCLIDMMGVLFLKAGSWEMVDLHTFYTKNRAYYYSFEFTSDDTMYIWILGEPIFDPGVTHSDELMYIFSMPAEMDGNQVTTMDRMTTLWTNFATYLDPTPAENTNWVELNIPYFEPYKFEDHRYLLIRDEITVGKEFSDRWTVTVDELREWNTTSTTVETIDETTVKTIDETTVKTIDETTVKTTVTTTVPPAVDPADYVPRSEYDDVAQQRDAFEAAMIVFIIAFVIICGIAVYFFFKGRN